MKISYWWPDKGKFRVTSSPLTVKEGKVEIYHLVV